MKTRKIFATMFAMVCILIFSATTPVLAQDDLSKKEKAALYDQAVNEAAQAKANEAKAKKAADKLAKDNAKKIADLEAKLAATQTQPAPAQIEPPAQEVPHDLNTSGGPVINTTMDQLSKNQNMLPDPNAKPAKKAPIVKGKQVLIDSEKNVVYCTQSNWEENEDELKKMAPNTETEFKIVPM